MILDEMFTAEEVVEEEAHMKTYKQKETKNKQNW